MKFISYQDNTVVGNIENKESLKNPIARLLVNRFDKTLIDLLQYCEPKSLHEVGCGEGRLTRLFATHYPDIPIRASDIGRELIRRLRSNSLPNVDYVLKSAYNLTLKEDNADVIVCCEVLEHLEKPIEALRILKALNANRYVFSVPREPLWRILNVFRGKYLRTFGNTPGHINHWSKNSFLALLSKTNFMIDMARFPLPWTIVLGSFRCDSGALCEKSSYMCRKGQC
jgi:2-polyprenyl-3-methyl-5-hydroxy-6-metoxy-1,4-benzoquinol methylase